MIIKKVDPEMVVELELIRAKNAEMTTKLDILMEFMGVHGKWNGDVFQVVKQNPETGDYTDPIRWAVGDEVTSGLWYYDEDKDLPHEAIANGTPLNFYDKQYFDFVK